MMSFRIFFSRVLSFLNRKIRSTFLLVNDNLFTTYSDNQNELVEMSFDLSLISKIPSEIIDLYHLHYFDILGSGWTQVCHNKKYRGFENNNYFFKNYKKVNFSNRNYANELNNKLDKNYKLIDWQVDIKSGFRWSSSTHSKFINFSDYPGVDVKIPWELARMHHLVHLATDYSKNSNSSKKSNNKLEFENQVIDFIANNPPSFGVNWVCSMDVAIRISNILLAFDIFKSSKCNFSNDFIKILANSTYDHGKHIINNLEWSNGKRGNHYFSNIIGLLFCSSHLKINDVSQAWFTFGASELINELDYQFHSDGGNFEGSTLYHRLVTEFATWGTVLVVNNSNKFLKNYSNNEILKYIYKKNKRVKNNFNIKNPFVFQKKYFKKLKKTLNFLDDIMMYDGSIPQIGDNDSGRLFKLNPNYKKSLLKYFKKNYANLKAYDELDDYEPYFLENHLQADSFLKISNSLLHSSLYLNNYQKNHSKFHNQEFNYLKSLFFYKTDKQNYFNNSNNRIEIYSKQKINYHLKDSISNNSKEIKKYYFKFSDDDLKNELKIIKYELFGIYIYKAKNLYLLIRSKNHKIPPLKSGHYHQDQLSIELHINKTPIVVDPGTYVYTSSPKKRNLYRSENSHFSPITNYNIQLCNYKNIFKLNEVYSSKVFHFSDDGFYGSVFFNNNLYERILLLKNNRIEVIDISPSDQINNTYVKLPFSPGYGILRADLND